jgi:hypothetical protein
MPPPAEHADPPSKRNRVIVHSAARNLSADPTPACYTITFDEPYTDVTALELICADVPLTAYQVCASNRAMKFRGSDGVTRTATLTPGDYEPPALLADEVAARMNDAAGTPGLYACAYDPRRDSFAFSSAQAFTLLFASPDSGDVAYASGSPARILGFGPRDYAAELADQSVYRVLSEFRRDVSHTKTAVICIDTADVNTSAANPFNRSFAIVGPSATEIYAWQPKRQAIKTYNPPIGKYARMRVRVLDVFGEPYDTQNHDHRLEFMITSSPRYQSRQNWTLRPMD